MVENTSLNDSKNIKLKDLNFAPGRIRTIMKSATDMNVNQDALFLVTKSSELFLQYLARRAFESKNKNTLEYKSVAELVEKDDKFEFLALVIPKKITVKQAKEMIAVQSDEEDSESTTDDSSESGSESSSEDERHKRTKNKSHNSSQINNSRSKPVSNANTSTNSAPKISNEIIELDSSSSSS